MFGQRASAPALGGLTIGTSGTSSLFGTNPSQPTSTPTTAAGSGSGFGGSLFGSTTATSQPQSGGLFGGGSTTATSQPQAGGSLFNRTTQQTPQAAGGLFGGEGTGTTGASQPQTGGSLFGQIGAPQQSQQQQQPQQQQQSSLFGQTAPSQQQQQQQPGSSLFGQTAPTQQQQGGSLFGQTATSQPQAGSSLFGQTTAVPQSGGGGLFSGLGGGQNGPQQQKPLFGGLGQPAGTTQTGGGLFGTSAQQGQQQQQQPQQQGPTLSLFGTQNAQQTQQPAGSNVVPGVKIDLTNLVPTTKFESCSDELKREIEAIDTAILNQIKMCNEVADLLPTIAAQISSVPHDVEFLEGKLDTLQEALENDAAGIENARNTVKQDAADAKLAFRALDTLLLPLQYQMSVGDRWWSSSQQAQSFSKHSLRSALGPRHSLLSLPEDAEADASAESGGPSNLVEYFSKRADEMNQVVESYRKNLKDVEDHLHGVEANLHHQINELASAKSKEGQGYKRTSRVSELAATLADVETAILGVAGRLGTVKEEVQEMSLGPLGASGFGRPNGR